MWRHLFTVPWNKNTSQKKCYFLMFGFVPKFVSSFNHSICLHRKSPSFWTEGVDSLVLPSELSSDLHPLVVPYSRGFKCASSSLLIPSALHKALRAWNASPLYIGPWLLTCSRTPLKANESGWLVLLLFFFFFGNDSNQIQELPCWNHSLLHYWLVGTGR